MTDPSRPAASVDDLPPPAPETLRLRTAYWTRRAAWEVAARVPERAGWRIAERAGDLWYRRASDAQRKQVRANLARVAGRPMDRAELEEFVRAGYRAYARYWYDAFRVDRMDPDWVLSAVQDGGTESLAEMHADGGGIMATAHVGSWDVAALYCRERGWHLGAVAEVVEPRRLFDRFVAARRAIGLEIFPLVRGGDMVTRLEGVIERGGIATLVADRDLTKKGPVVDFFGEPCRLPPGPAVLARRTGRPVIAAAGFSTPDGWLMLSRPAVDVADLTVEEGTQVVAHELEQLIATAPEQWHVFVPNWLRDREPDHPMVRGRAAPAPSEG